MEEMASATPVQAGGEHPASKARWHDLAGRISDSFFRLNIVRKLLLGYLPLFVLLALVAILGLMSFTTLNQLNSSILETDIPMMQLADQMKDDVLGQELYAKRFAILKDTETLEIFKQRLDDFQQRLVALAFLPEERQLPITQLVEHHQDYQQFLVDHFVAPADVLPDKAAVEQLLRARQDEVMEHIQQIMEVAHQDQVDKTRQATAMGKNAFRVAVMVCLVGLVVAVLAVFIVTRNIAGTLRKLQRATEEMAAGNFDYDPDVRNADELGDLAQAFRHMGNRLKVLESAYRDASPLTGLPGGISIHRAVDAILAQDNALAFCLFDIDSFKSFNDCYGFARGNKVIEAAATLIKAVVAEKGADDDFVGHIGGDDFVVLCRHYQYLPLCQEIIGRFDAEIVSFYDAADRAKGFIETENRQGAVVQFPVASLSVAVVTNERRHFSGHLEVGEVAAEVKKAAKKKRGSVIVVDSRFGA
jgi:diguanylate cyclase (GGDEF)-like protein